jgi:hypothetical protein
VEELCACLEVRSRVGSRTVACSDSRGRSLRLVGRFIKCLTTDGASQRGGPGWRMFLSLVASC